MNSFGLGLFLLPGLKALGFCDGLNLGLPCSFFSSTFTLFNDGERGIWDGLPGLNLGLLDS